MRRYGGTIRHERRWIKDFQIKGRFFSSDLARSKKPKTKSQTLKAGTLSTPHLIDERGKRFQVDGGLCHVLRTTKKGWEA
jgi:hypothetical protein